MTQYAETTASIANRYKGLLIGLAIGDTLGMPIEFKAIGEFEPLMKPEAGGVFDLPIGYWTDDTSMALCLADSLIEKKGYDSYDVMDKYNAWFTYGYRSSNGICFDIGSQVKASLVEYTHDGLGVIRKTKKRLSSAGNGSIMRLAPVIIASHAAGNTLEETMELARISARETHYSYVAEEGTALFGAMLFNALEQKNKNQLLAIGNYPRNEHMGIVLDALFRVGTQSVQEVVPSGYIVDSLVCATWALLRHDNFRDGALAAVNLGGDADTIGAIYGQLAGAYYGYDSIPFEWRDVLYQEEKIRRLAEKIGRLSSCKVIRTRFEEDGKNYATKLNICAMHADITQLKVDAIVNAANTELFGGSGVCGAIFDAAGYEKMTEICAAIGYCEYGDAVITPGFKLPAKHVIHTVGPIYGQHNGNEQDILQSCYWQSLHIAQDRRLRTIAFPLISTGIYGYPKREAIKVALSAIKIFYNDNPHTSVEKIILVAYNQDEFNLLEKTMHVEHI